jgi:hypothetical protein
MMRHDMDDQKQEGQKHHSEPLVMVKRFRDLPEAQVAESILDASGIDCFLADETTIRMDWLWSNLLGGFKLMVRPEDQLAALELLNQPIPESFTVGAQVPYRQPRCPKCRSLDVSFQELNRRIAFPSILVGVPVPLKKKGWCCHACQHRWEQLLDERANSESSPENLP